MLTDRSQLGSTDQPCRAWRRVLSIIISRQMRNVRNPSSKLYWVALLCIHRLAMSQRTWVQLWSALRLIDWCVRIPNQPLHLCAFTCHVHLYKHTSETPSVKRTCETSSLTIAWLSLYIYISVDRFAPRRGNAKLNGSISVDPTILLPLQGCSIYTRVHNNHDDDMMSEVGQGVACNNNQFKYSNKNMKLKSELHLYI